MHIVTESETTGIDNTAYIFEVASKNRDGFYGDPISFASTELNSILVEIADYFNSFEESSHTFEVTERYANDDFSHVEGYIEGVQDGVDVSILVTAERDED